jgi:plasmid stabilization system protein ParE
MREFIVSSEAFRDLLEIWGYIALDSVEAADRVESEFHQTFQMLARMPGLGHRRSELTSEDLLFWTLYSYLIVYKRIGNHIRIVAVLHGRRDVKKVLKQRNQ